MLTIVDTSSRFSPVLDAPVQLPWRGCGGDPRSGLAEVGFPRTIRVDQGSEFISRFLELWAYLHGVTLDFSRLGKPTDNAVGSVLVAVRAPSLQLFAGIGKGQEPLGVQALAPESGR